MNDLNLIQKFILRLYILLFRATKEKKFDLLIYAVFALAIGVAIWSFLIRYQAAIKHFIK